MSKYKKLKKATYVTGLAHTMTVSTGRDVLITKYIVNIHPERLNNNKPLKIRHGRNWLIAMWAQARVWSFDNESALPAPYIPSNWAVRWRFQSGKHSTGQTRKIKISGKH